MHLHAKGEQERPEKDSLSLNPGAGAGVHFKTLNLNKAKICFFPWTRLPSSPVTPPPLQTGRRAGMLCAPAGPPGALCSSQGQTWHCCPREERKLPEPSVSFPAVCPPPSPTPQVAVSIPPPGVPRILSLTCSASSTICLERHHLVETGTPTPVAGASLEKGGGEQSRFCTIPSLTLIR